MSGMGSRDGSVDCHLYDMAYPRISLVTQANQSCHTCMKLRAACMNESCHICEFMLHM